MIQSQGSQICQELTDSFFLFYFNCPVVRSSVVLRFVSEGVNTLACRVVAGVMTMAGQDGAAKWCREPEFLGRCAARLQEMMEDPKVGQDDGRCGPRSDAVVQSWLPWR